MTDNNNKKPTPIKGKHEFLITDPNEITAEHIDKVYDLVVEGNFAETAIGMVGIDPEFFYKLMNNRKQYALGKYAHDTLKQAEWAKENKFLKDIINPEKFNSKILFDFVKATNPKLQARTRMQIKYEIMLIMKAMRKYHSDKNWEAVLAELEQMDPVGCIAELDELLLHE